MSTSLERIESALKVDVVIAAQEAARALDTYDVASVQMDDLPGIADRGTIIANAIRKLEAEEQEILAPAKRAYDETRELVKRKLGPVLEPLVRAKAKASGLYLDAKRVLARRAEQERAAAEAEAKAAAQAASVESPDEPPLEIPAAAVRVEAPANSAKGGVGMAVGRKDVTVEMVDVALVARHYPSLLTLDRAAAKRLVKAEIARAEALGVDPKLPGLAWSETETAAFRTR